TQAVVSEGGLQGITSRVDGRVMGVAAAATVVSALLFGLIPAWRAARTGVSQMLKDQGSTTSAGPGHVRFRKYLVAGQVAFTLLLLTGGALFSRTLWNLRKQDLGLTTENLITFSIAPQLSGYDEARTVALVDQLRERLGALPGGIGVQVALGGGNEVERNIEIVGVVRNAKEGHVRDRERPYFYQPYSQFGKLYGMSFYARSQQDPLLIANALRETVRRADANLPVY